MKMQMVPFFRNSDSALISFDQMLDDILRVNGSKDQAEKLGGILAQDGASVFGAAQIGAFNGMYSYHQAEFCKRVSRASCILLDNGLSGEAFRLFFNVPIKDKVAADAFCKKALSRNVGPVWSLPELKRIYETFDDKEAAKDELAKHFLASFSDYAQKKTEQDGVKTSSFSTFCSLLLSATQGKVLEPFLRAFADTISAPDYSLPDEKRSWCKLAGILIDSCSKNANSNSALLLRAGTAIVDLLEKKTFVDTLPADSFLPLSGAVRKMARDFSSGRKGIGAHLEEDMQKLVERVDDILTDAIPRFIDKGFHAAAYEVLRSKAQHEGGAAHDLRGLIWQISHGYVCVVDGAEPLVVVRHLPSDRTQVTRSYVEACIEVLSDDQLRAGIPMPETSPAKKIALLPSFKDALKGRLASIRAASIRDANLPAT